MKFPFSNFNRILSVKISLFAIIQYIFIDLIMAKRKADDTEDLFTASKFSKVTDSDAEDSGSDDGEKYEILKEDDIEGQEAGNVTREGDIQITPFNMKEEMEEGHFDTEGMYHWNKEAEIKDNWLDNIDWVKLKENDQAVVKNTESENEEETEFDDIYYYKQILPFMCEKETVAATLRRLGGSTSLSASERLKRKKAGLANYKDKHENKEAVTKVTELANTILTRTGNMDIYQETYEKILEKVNKAAEKTSAPVRSATPELDMYADDFGEKEKAGLDNANTSKESVSNDEGNKEVQWELKRDLSDTKVEGPYPTEQMQEWIKTKHFQARIWVRQVGSSSEFYSSDRIDFELYL